jgi:hypothetical protein
VDDEVSIRTLLRDFLSIMKYEVTVAANAEAARAAAEWVQDLLICDINVADKYISFWDVSAIVLPCPLKMPDRYLQSNNSCFELKLLIWSWKAEKPNGKQPSLLEFHVCMWASGVGPLNKADILR